MSGVVAGLKALGPKRLMALGGTGAALLAVLAVLAVRAGEAPMAPLFGDMEARDAAAVVASLERQRVPYRLEAAGTRILAPADQVPRLRLVLAREGLPAGGGVGWEIFDRAESLTTTPFQQDVNRLRALEGEIARTIRGLAGVRTARVHLALPRREAFSRERGEAQASVVLAMQGAQRLDRDGVQAVLHLVATAVPGLKPSGVSIVDSRGELLARGGQTLSGGPAAQGAGAVLSQEELRRAHEMRIGRSVEELLERTLGPGRVRAEATVEMDFDRVQTTEERFDPENQVARSQQSVNEQNRGAEPQPTTVAGNLPGNEGQGGGGAASQESRQEETTNYEIGRSTRNTVREHPVVRRLSVAVLVDGVAEARPGEAAPAWRERTPEELARIASLVRSAVGFDERRGDRVEVVSMRFVQEPGTAAEPAGPLGLPALPPALLARLAESGLLALVALVGILAVGRPIVGRLSAALVPLEVGPAALVGAPGAAPPAGSGAAASGSPGAAAPGAVVGAAAAGALPAAGGEGPLPETLVSLPHVQGQMRESSLTMVAKLVEKHPEEALSVLRRWLGPQEAGRA
jgi:flagellar M-ring protein FliF